MDVVSPTWFQELSWYLVTLLPGGLFTVWCLWGVDWRRAWPVLATGGWVPLVLLGLMAAFVWSLVSPTNAIVFGFLVVPNLLWQLGSVAILIGVALFCGWLQTHYGGEPPEIDLEPPAHGHGHGHDDHAHAHTHGHPTH